MQVRKKKPYKGIGMEGIVARWYASTTRKTMPEQRELAGRISAGLPPGARVLEIAPGPGYLAIELARNGSSVAAIDISRTFVKIGRRNAEEAAVQVDFRHGDVADMPFRDAEFDFLVCRAAFKNFSEPARALQEMHRVLAPGGRALILDLRRDASTEAIDAEVNGMRLGALSGAFTKLVFRHMLLKRAYTRGDLEALVSQTRFGDASFRENGIELEVALRK
jgi:ubiquinone/menaquinone biosynthesis C-methylase UbiE